MTHKTYQTHAGLTVAYEDESLTYENAIAPLLKQLDTFRGALYTSSFEFPGRYTLWDVGFVNPPLVITSHHRNITISALNERGDVLLRMMKSAIEGIQHVNVLSVASNEIRLHVDETTETFAEEMRSMQPSVFSVIRSLIQYFYHSEEQYLGLYGAFGYDLIFQFESFTKSKKRDTKSPEMVLYLPDEIYIVNHRTEKAFIRRYDFSLDNLSTRGKSRHTTPVTSKAQRMVTEDCDHQAGEYAETVKKARQKFKHGDLFEVVPSQTFYKSCKEKPTTIFKRLKLSNPAPYGFLINLGEEEYLIGASPEMYVRVTDGRVETCPISGTIKRGESPIEDANQIEALLRSDKERAELTMCTDVDRNDKSRICAPGSVKVIGRRQIEMYSRLIHTVDHVEGMLREGFDAIDAFLTHMWVVTVTGAPKLWAMSFIEQHEKSPRHWYAGAVGWLGFNGNMNTGLTLRTIRLYHGMAEVRAGATLLYDSDPDLEEAETRLKAKALMAVLEGGSKHAHQNPPISQTGQGKKILLIDNEDSFVHTLANYFRQTGAEVITTRDRLDLSLWDACQPDLIVISPGPGSPQDFDLKKVIETALDRNLPIFGVCLGFQAIVEYFGGSLKVLDYPMHGKSSLVTPEGEGLFAKIKTPFTAARYHSLFCPQETLPEALKATAMSEDGVLMAVEGRNLPIFGVQFHPEAILSLAHNTGLKLIERVMELI